MKEKYDGWCIKNIWADPPDILPWFFERTKEMVIAKYEKMRGRGMWEKKRKSGHLKLVRVRLVEVE